MSKCPDVVPAEYSQTPPAATYFHFRFPRGDPQTSNTANVNVKKKLCHKIRASNPDKMSTQDGRVAKYSDFRPIDGYIPETVIYRR